MTQKLKFNKEIMNNIHLIPEFIDACKHNQYEKIKQLILDGIDVNTVFKPLPQHSDKEVNIYLYYAQSNNDYTLLPFFLSQGINLYQENEQLFKKLGKNNRIDILKILHEFDVDLISHDCLWVILGVGYGHQNILHFFLNLIQEEQQQYKVTKKVMNGIFNNLIFYKNKSLLEQILAFAQKNPYIYQLIHCDDSQLEKLSRGEKIKEKQFDLFRIVQMAIRSIHSTNIEIVDILLKQTLWQIEEKSLYRKVFLYAAEFNALDVLDYVWSQGYHYDNDTVSMCIDTMEVIPTEKTRKYIDHSLEKIHLAKMLSQDLKEQQIISQKKV